MQQTAEAKEASAMGFLYAIIIAITVVILVLGGGTFYTAGKGLESAGNAMMFAIPVILVIGTLFCIGYYLYVKLYRDVTFFVFKACANAADDTGCGIGSGGVDAGKYWWENPVTKMQLVNGPIQQFEKPPIFYYVAGAGNSSGQLHYDSETPTTMITLRTTLSVGDGEYSSDVVKNDVAELLGYKKKYSDLKDDDKADVDDVLNKLPPHFVSVWKGKERNFLIVDNDGVLRPGGVEDAQSGKVAKIEITTDVPSGLKINTGLGRN